MLCFVCLSVICNCLYAFCHNIFYLLLYMSVKSSTELMLYFKENFYTLYFIYTIITRITPLKHRKVLLKYPFSVTHGSYDLAPKPPAE